MKFTKFVVITLDASALETRGRDMRSYRDPAVEPLKEKVGTARNPIADGSKLPSKYKKPITKG